MTLLERIIAWLVGQIWHPEEPTPQPVPIPAPEPLPTPPPVPTPLPSHIPLWAAAIQVQEGFAPGSVSYVNNNPGNLKYTAYTKTLGAIGHDGHNFCIFKDYTAGTKALQQFLIDACQGRLLSYKPSMTLKEFTQIYAEPPSLNYVTGVAKTLGVPITIEIQELL